MDPIQTTAQPPVQCSNCQKVVTHDGKTVWVCEDCGTENLPADASQAMQAGLPAVAAVAPAAAAPAMPEGPAPIIPPVEQPTV